VYRSRPRLLRRRDSGRDGLATLREGGGRLLRIPAPEPEPGRRRRLRLRRVLGFLALFAVGWVLVSLVLFLVSAQLARDDVGDAAQTALDPSGFTLTTPNTILVLGSDARTEETAEPGSRVGGPSRADTLLLMRVGAGRSARLSIPRDTVVDIPGRGRDKINAAYAFGGPALAVTTVKQFLGIEVNHVVEVNFENFPSFIDALGGIDYTGGCVVSRINGGARNGGYTLRLRRGTNRLDGEQALALARTRRNECNPRENDLTRVRRQQKILAAIKDRLLSPSTAVRLPLVSWAAPQAVRSDMAGPALLGLFASVATAGSPTTQVLRPSGTVELPNGGAGLVVSEENKRRAVERFLAG